MTTLPNSLVRIIGQVGLDRLRKGAAYMKPTIGCIVLYRGKMGVCALRPAIVTCTRETLITSQVLTGQIPDLDSDTNVHLHVLTPSDQGFFVEYDVPQGNNPSDPDPGTWVWPPRV